MILRGYVLYLLLGWVMPFALSASEAATPWYLQAIERPAQPAIPSAPGSWKSNPIDAFLYARLQEAGLEPSSEADRRILIRRATYDLTGLPPSPEEVIRFVDDQDPMAYVKLVDRLLASPRYGERWARHWMDLVHFAETQGHDEDAIRENAWPYRDYLIASLNGDKSYSQFILEQVAGDVLFPEDPQATVATGFLAAGPWDGSSQMGIQDGTVDKRIAQYLDRDDMLATTMGTFISLTVQCARCHDHKFDPVTLHDYYALQAVFAGVDRVDRPYDPDTETFRQRKRLTEEKAHLENPKYPPAHHLTPDLLDQVAQWAGEQARQASGWIVFEPDTVTSTAGQTLEPQPDGSFLAIGNRPDKDTYILTGQAGISRVTAIQIEVLSDQRLPMNGPGRQDNGNLHLSELYLEANHSGDSGAFQTIPLDRAVSDFDQAGWTVAMALDRKPETAWGIYPKVGQSHRAIFHLAEPLSCGPETRLSLKLEQNHGGGHLIGRPRLSLTTEGKPALEPPLPADLLSLVRKPAQSWNPSEQHRMTRHYIIARNRQARSQLPPQKQVFAVASDFQPKGNFKPAGKPRPVHVLERGNIHAPIAEANPGSLDCLSHLPVAFPSKPGHPEGARRAALARWLAHPENPMTWRSIVNRIWQHHMGAGLVATPNDFGKMGATPSHPTLLDWLAFEFRAQGGSFKHLHRLIMTTAAYRQGTRENPVALTVDAGNRLLWRMRPRRRDAESIRDSILFLSGSLDLQMGGPSARLFNLSKGVHITPKLDYIGFDPEHRANFRRNIYQFLFRTVPDPWMKTLDCPDASQRTDRRTTSFTPSQALALSHSPFVISQSRHMAARLRREGGALPDQVSRLFLLAYARPPTPQEQDLTVAYARDHGLANACRTIFNSNEFLFVE